jgi:hypothetical protein
MAVQESTAQQDLRVQTSDALAIQLQPEQGISVRCIGYEYRQFRNPLARQLPNGDDGWCGTALLEKSGKESYSVLRYRTASPTSSSFEFGTELPKVSYMSSFQMTRFVFGSISINSGWPGPA